MVFTAIFWYNKWEKKEDGHHLDRDSEARCKKMKNAVQKSIKGISFLLAAILLVIVIGGSVFGIKGYRLYHKEEKAAPLDKKVESIQSMEHFVKYEDLPGIYVDAVVSVEDHRFWSHKGVDPIAVGRAFWNDIRSLSFKEGGSTITQQLAKNLYFTQEKTLERKAAEVFAAFDLEARYDKKEIFELYVNTIYFGSGYYGIYDAAMGYYEKKPSELSQGEAVMLAGLPNAPSAYSPDADPDLARQRMNQVLERMEACGVISKDEGKKLISAAP